MANKHYIRLQNSGVICVDDIMYISEPLSDGVSRCIVLRGWDRYENIHTEEEYGAIVRVMMMDASDFIDCIKKETDGENNISKNLR